MIKKQFIEFSSSFQRFANHLKRIQSDCLIWNSNINFQTNMSQPIQSKPKILFTPIMITPLNQLECFSSKNIPQGQRSIKKINQSEKNSTEDQEYTPDDCLYKKINIRKKQQNKERNIVPNIVNQVLSFIQKKKKSSSVANKIFIKYNRNREWSVGKFYLYQQQLKSKTYQYVDEDSLRIYSKTGYVDFQIFDFEEQKFYNKVSRILSLFFLKNEAQILTLTSKRIDKSRKAAHIKAQIKLVEKLKLIYQLQ